MANVCSINGNKMNAPTASVLAALATLVVGLAIITQTPVIFIFWAVVFFIRGFYQKEWCVLTFSSTNISNLLKFKNKLIEPEGKRFTSKIGFIFSVLFFVKGIYSFAARVSWLGVFFMSYAFLNVAFSFCIGCQVYTWYSNLNPRLHE
jgi:hypothetical protein